MENDLRALTFKQWEEKPLNYSLRQFKEEFKTLIECLEEKLSLLPFSTHIFQQKHRQLRNHSKLMAGHDFNNSQHQHANNVNYE